MRLTAAIFSVFLCIFCVGFFSGVQAKDNLLVEVQKPYANIYEYLDPTSNIIRQAKLGEHLELVYEGTSWYQVKTRGRFGWLEKRAGKVVDNPSRFLNSVSYSSVIIFLVLIAATLGGVTYYILRQKEAEL
jgi:predicted PurR-regulated permease PerM